MAEIKLPIDLHEHTEYQATALLKEGEEHLGEREYIVRLWPPNNGWDEEGNRIKGDPVVLCRSELQLSLVYHGMSLNPQRDEEDQVITALWHIAGRIMSQRLFNQDFYQSGRENMGYELTWLPGGAHEQIVAALERSGNNGLAALMREGRLEKK